MYISEQYKSYKNLGERLIYILISMWFLLLSVNAFVIVFALDYDILLTIIYDCASVRWYCVLIIDVDLQDH